MKENLIDILIYLFEHYLVEQTEEFVQLDNQKLTGELLEVGFEKQEIDQAFSWLDELIAGSDKSLDSFSPVATLRIFSKQEKARIPLEAQSLIMRLEQAGILELSTRELVIDRLMALDYQAVDMEDVKWVIMMVLCNQSDFPQELEWAESLVSDNILTIH